jgi:hypothetical protein
MSWPRRIAALSAALAILLGLTVLVGWAFHSWSVIKISPKLAPMQPTTAISFISAGLGLMGIILAKRRWIFVTCGLLAALATIGLLEYLVGVRSGPLMAGCHRLQACAFWCSPSAVHGLKCARSAVDRRCLA